VQAKNTTANLKNCGLQRRRQQLVLDIAFPGWRGAEQSDINTRKKLKTCFFFSGPRNIRFTTSPLLALSDEDAG